MSRSFVTDLRHVPLCHVPRTYRYLERPPTPSRAASQSNNDTAPHNRKPPICNRRYPETSIKLPHTSQTEHEDEHEYLFVVVFVRGVFIFVYRWCYRRCDRVLSLATRAGIFLILLHMHHEARSSSSTSSTRESRIPRGPYASRGPINIPQMYFGV